MAEFRNTSPTFCAFSNLRCETGLNFGKPLVQLSPRSGSIQDDGKHERHIFEERTYTKGSRCFFFGIAPAAESSLQAVHPRKCFYRVAFYKRSSHYFIVLEAIFLLFFAHLSVTSKGEADFLSLMRDSTYSANSSANAVRREGVDDSLRKYAFMALSHARTGTIYNVTLTPHFNGIIAQAIRLRSGSVTRRGLTFNEFKVPEGAITTGGPVVVMVYRKIFNFTVYSLPTGYTFVGPVVGIVIYTSVNVSFDDEPLPEMSFTSQKAPITVKIPISQPIGKAVPLCAFFYVNGSMTFTNVSSLPNVCSSASLGDVSLVFSKPPLVPSPAPTAREMNPSAPSKRSNNRRILVAIVFGAIAGLAVLIVIAILGRRLVEKVRLTIMKRLAKNRETLQTSSIGTIRAPTAAGLRTRPILERE